VYRSVEWFVEWGFGGTAHCAPRAQNPFWVGRTQLLEVGDAALGARDNYSFVFYYTYTTKIEARGIAALAVGGTAALASRASAAGLEGTGPEVVKGCEFVPAATCGSPD